MKRIEKTPISFSFKPDNKRSGTLTIKEEDTKGIYIFEITTPVLYRMKDERDNRVSLYLNGRWETFTTGLYSSLEDASLSLTLLENNNKRSRYILKIETPQVLPIEIDAKAEGLSLE